jgi:hypothetical protein
MSECGVLVLDLNEVSFRVLGDFAKYRPVSCVIRLLPFGQQFETYSQDIAVCPWVTWPAVRRALTAIDTINIDSTILKLLGVMAP